MTIGAAEKRCNATRYAKNVVLQRFWAIFAGKACDIAVDAKTLVSLGDWSWREKRRETTGLDAAANESGAGLPPSTVQSLVDTLRASP